MLKLLEKYAKQVLLLTSLSSQKVENVDFIKLSVKGAPA